MSLLVPVCIFVFTLWGPTRISARTLVGSSDVDKGQALFGRAVGRIATPCASAASRGRVDVLVKQKLVGASRRQPQISGAVSSTQLTLPTHLRLHCSVGPVAPNNLQRTPEPIHKSLYESSASTWTHCFRHTHY